MPHRTVEIETLDGRCPAHVMTPDGSGPWPAVIVFMDGIGMRPAIEEIGARLAREGYFTLLPNLFYRVEFTALDPAKAFTDPVLRDDLMNRVMPSASPANVTRDTQVFLRWLDAQPDVMHGPIGLVGYCMGGRLALYVAGQLGDRIAAVASYHGSGLATDAPDSPHRFADDIRAKVYVAGAIEDRGFDDAQKARLEQALTAAGVDHVVTTYPARHGWVPSDTPVHDDAQTARHWESLLDLFGEMLGGGRAASR